MSRLLKNIFLIFTVFLFCLTLVYAEDITITTYYPSPYGSYKNLNIYNIDESTTQTDFTQGVTKAGLLITTELTDTAYTPGIFWSTSNNNATKPKAGIYLRESSASGTSMYFGTSNAYATGITNNAVIIDPSGNVGIGAAPGAKLAISSLGAANNLLRFDIDRPWKFRNTGTGGTTVLELMSEIDSKQFRIVSDNGTTRAMEVLVSSTAASNRVYLVPDGGYVGIGMSPSYALDVTGQIRMSGASGVPVKYVLDVAEVIPVADDVEEGDVACIDNTVEKYQFAKSKIPDSPLVVGVISSTKKNSKSIPALFIGDSEQKQKDNPNQKYKYLTIAGQIAVKVCLEGGAIKKGDLLTTSSVSGYAMKSQKKQLGTLIGKALEDFDGKDGEKGIIIALLNLM
ncbi:MAG: hypothetical protein NT014_04830 [Candidatus Omnitrophica bacterium]|nr:hypothetical protein [Candidatus Omnitrophota bacterium]